MTRPAVLFEGSVLFVVADSGPAIDYSHLLESRGYRVLRADDVAQATSHLKRCGDILLVVTAGHSSIDDDIGAARALRDVMREAPWIEYLVLRTDASAQPTIAMTDQEAEWIVAAHDRDAAMPAITEAYNLAHMQCYQANELRDLEHSLQEFRAQTEAAFSQLLTRMRGRFSSAGLLRPGPAAETLSSHAALARAMAQERERARVRDGLFGSYRLGHAGWVLMLVLAEALAFGNELTVKSAAYAAGIPLSSALRKINELVEDGLLLRRPDLSDNRRSFVALSERAKNLLSDYLSAVDPAARQ